MSVTINGSGTIGGLTAGGLPDGTVTAADLANTLDLSSKTVTLPAGVGGKVLQVVQHTSTAVSGTTATSFVDTGFQGQITLLKANSRVLVSFCVPVSGKGSFRILRDGVEIYSQKGSGNPYAFFESTAQGAWNNGSQRVVSTFSFLDTPSTGAPIYKLQMVAYSTTGTGIGICEDSRVATLILMEIAQ